MTTLSIEESKLKSIFKTAILEVLDENHDMLIKNLEDSAFLTAIKEGESSDTVSRQEVFKLLDK
jgi:ribosomal protein L12E/L44/L45/RPP1/RPP2